MKVLVHFFSYYRLIAGMESTEVKLPENATVSDLLHELQKQIPDITSKLEQTVILVNQHRTSMITELKDKDKVSMLYLIGGG